MVKSQIAIFSTASIHLDAENHVFKVDIEIFSTGSVPFDAGSHVATSELEIFFTGSVLFDAGSRVCVCVCVCVCMCVCCVCCVDVGGCASVHMAHNYFDKASKPKQHSKYTSHFKCSGIMYVHL